jgi:hypothetical protein
MSPAREPAGSDVSCPEVSFPDATGADLRQAAAAFVRVEAMAEGKPSPCSYYSEFFEDGYH